MPDFLSRLLGRALGTETVLHHRRRSIFEATAEGPVLPAAGVHRLPPLLDAPAPDAVDDQTPVRQGAQPRRRARPPDRAAAEALPEPPAAVTRETPAPGRRREQRIDEGPPAAGLPRPVTAPPMPATTGPVPMRAAGDGAQRPAPVASAPRRERHEPLLEPDARPLLVAAPRAHRPVPPSPPRSIGHVATRSLPERSSGQARRAAAAAPNRTAMQGVQTPVRPPAAPMAAPADVAPTVHVTIGRIEVRATAAEAPPARSARPAGPRLTLDQYLRSRGGSGR